MRVARASTLLLCRAFATAAKTSMQAAFDALQLELHRVRNDARNAHIREAIASHGALEQLHRELRLGRQRLREAIQAIRSDMRLQRALEKQRQRDQALEIDMRLQQFRAKIDGEAGNCLAAVEKLRHDIYYSLSGFFFTATAALLGYLRFFS